MDLETEHVIPAIGHVTLLSYRYSINDEAKSAFADDVRRALGEITLFLSYEDLYRIHEFQLRRGMDWFLRRFKENQTTE